jgi:putative ABC transport system substrate-binding protein
MRRREFITLLGGAAAVWPIAASAQQGGKVARIGTFTVSDNPVTGAAYRVFLEELRKLGFSDGQNLIVEWRPANQESPALAAAATEIVRANADLIFAAGTEAVLQAAIAASRTIPIVIVAINYDPIARGYVKSLAQPGGNVSGVVLRQTELAEKQVELLTQAFPDKTRIAVLWDSFTADQFGAAERLAKSLRLEVGSLKLERPPYDFDAAFRTLADGRPNMLLVLSSPFFAQSNRHIAELAILYRIPAMYIFRGYVEAGGLMSYGADIVAMYRQSATHVAKILKGAKPADLPVEQPTRFELVINLKTAKAIGIELPTAILLRADEVIE